MNYSVENNEITIELAETFNNFGFQLLHVKCGGNLPVFLITPPEEKSLDELWEAITTFIAGNYQINLPTEFETWNIYLFFLFSGAIEKSLKYKIENDTFSSRKIVIESQTDIEQILNDHILNKDLAIQPTRSTSNEDIFTGNSVIWNALKGKTVRKKKRTSEADDAYNEVIKTLKNKGNEI